MAVCAVSDLEVDPIRVRSPAVERLNSPTEAEAGDDKAKGALYQGKDLTQVDVKARTRPEPPIRTVLKKLSIRHINCASLARYNRVGNGSESVTGFNCSPSSTYVNRVAEQPDVPTEEKNRRPFAVGRSPLRQHDLRTLYAEVHRLRGPLEEPRGAVRAQPHGRGTIRVWPNR
jgi:hypothetical protein